jgi:FAD/FMN-containing dehydrogenase
MSQNGMFWGASRGSIVPSAIAFDVIIADGTIVKTGSDFLRPFGPDLTGLFGADAGAFGIKAHVTLPLVHDGEAFAYGSFAFDAPAHYCAAMKFLIFSTASKDRSG